MPSSPIKIKEEKMQYIISVLALVIMGFFIYNLKELMNKMKSGKIVNKHSILATSALVFHFAGMATHYLFGYMVSVLIAQLYLLGCLIYLFKKN